MVNFDIALVATARNGLMWEALGYDLQGNEVGGRFDTKPEAVEFVNYYNGKGGISNEQKYIFCFNRRREIDNIPDSHRNATIDLIPSKSRADKKAKQAITTLIHQAEIKAKLSELRDINENWFLQYENRSFVEYFNNRIEALEKEIVNE